MRRLAMAVLGFLACSAASLWADELSGKVKKVDADRNTLVLTVEHKDLTLPVDKDAKVLSLAGKGKKATYQDLDGGLKALKANTSVLVVREEKNGTNVVTEIKIVADEVKKKKKKNTN